MNSNGILVEDVTNFFGGISNSGAISGGRDGILVGDQGGSSGATLALATFSGGIVNSGAITAAENGIFVGAHNSSVDR